MKVKYVLFKEAIPFTAPRCDERDIISLAAGTDLRYPTIVWDMEVDAEHRVLKVTCTDEKGAEFINYVPVPNIRNYR